MFKNSKKNFQKKNRSSWIRRAVKPVIGLFLNFKLDSIDSFMNSRNFEKSLYGFTTEYIFFDYFSNNKVFSSQLLENRKNLLHVLCLTYNPEFNAYCLWSVKPLYSKMCSRNSRKNKDFWLTVILILINIFLLLHLLKLLCENIPKTM